MARLGDWRQAHILAAVPWACLIYLAQPFQSFNNFAVHAIGSYIFALGIGVSAVILLRLILVLSSDWMSHALRSVWNSLRLVWHTVWAPQSSPEVPEELDTDHRRWDHPYYDHQAIRAAARHSRMVVARRKRRAERRRKRRSSSTDNAQTSDGTETSALGAPSRSSGGTGAA